MKEHLFNVQHDQLGPGHHARLTVKEVAEPQELPSDVDPLGIVPTRAPAAAPGLFAAHAASEQGTHGAIFRIAVRAELPADNVEQL